MPVPVPRISDLSANSVHKDNPHPGNVDQSELSVFRNLTQTLPVSPTGPPPAFGTREEWINSLPTWRRTKPRRIWEDEFRAAESLRDKARLQEGPAPLASSFVSCGFQQQGCIPPLHTFLQNVGLAPVVYSAVTQQDLDGEADDEMSSDSSLVDRFPHENDSQWSASSPTDRLSYAMEVGHPMRFDTADGNVQGWRQISQTTLDRDYSCERGVFSPVLEDESPGLINGRDTGSSPLGPITPFGDFVDRAIAGQAYEAYEAHAMASFGMSDSQYLYETASDSIGLHAPKQPVEEGLTEPATAPSATSSYRKLAEPLSEWIAAYIWKVCTTGLGLPPRCVTSNFARQHSPDPPSYLAGSVHSLLLSTLLQPSAVVLALWYVVRLPVFFVPCPGGADFDELQFKIELLGDTNSGTERLNMEVQAPFRLFLLGCMLANKWLDDHTFSNKTWHTISHVPIQSLNRLESLALAIFKHDLTVSSKEWLLWLDHLLSYHRSLTSTVHPQPISRPSASPHSLIKKTIDDLIQVSAGLNSQVIEPIFIGLEERRREKRREEFSALHGVDVLEIDLDEDGPIREEYLPRRRVCAPGFFSDNRNTQYKSFTGWEKHAQVAGLLPPPAKWSPAGDEPIGRGTHRTSGRYMPVQPNFPQPQPYIAHYHPAPEVDTYVNWPAAPLLLPAQPLLLPGYVYDAPFPVHVASYNVGPPEVPISHSMRRDEVSQLHAYLPSYPQNRVEYRCSDLRVTAHDSGYQDSIDPHWLTSEQCAIASCAHLGARGEMDPRITWLRA